MQQTKAYQDPTQLRLWERIEIVVGEGPTAGRYLARVQDVLKDGIVITDPEFLGGSSLLRAEVSVNVMVTRADAVYEFRSVIKKNSPSSASQFLLSPPRQFERVQRRLFVRVELIRKLAYAILDESVDWRCYEKQLTWYKTQSVDISGGGIQFKLESELPAGTHVVLRMDFLQDLGVPEPLAGVIRRTLTRHREHFAGVEFVRSDQLDLIFGSDVAKSMPTSFHSFDRNAQNKLVSYIFLTQIELRKKGLL